MCGDIGLGALAPIPAIAERIITALEGGNSVSTMEFQGVEELENLHNKVGYSVSSCFGQRLYQSYLDSMRKMCACQ